MKRWIHADESFKRPFKYLQDVSFVYPESRLITV